MMNDLTGMEGRKLRMPSVSPLRVVGRVTGRQRGWALGINTIPFHFPASAFPVEMAKPRLDNLSSVWLREAMTICDSLLRGVHIPGWIQVGWLQVDRQEEAAVTDADRCITMDFFPLIRKITWNMLLGIGQLSRVSYCCMMVISNTSIHTITLVYIMDVFGTAGCIFPRYLLSDFIALKPHYFNLFVLLAFIDTGVF